MKLVRVTKKHTKKVDTIDPKAIEHDYEIVLKECKDCKKKVDKILDSGNVFDLTQAEHLFARAHVAMSDVRYEIQRFFMDQVQAGGKEEADFYAVMSDKIGKLSARLKIVEDYTEDAVRKAQELRVSTRALRKTNFNF